MYAYSSIGNIPIPEFFGRTSARLPEARRGTAQGRTVTELDYHVAGYSQLAIGEHDTRKGRFRRELS